jgi:hypothetical protein
MARIDPGSGVTYKLTVYAKAASRRQERASWACRDDELRVPIGTR